MTFQNADKLIKKLNLMSNEVQGEILKKSVKRGGLLVPVSYTHLTLPTNSLV